MAQEKPEDIEVNDEIVKLANTGRRRPAIILPKKQREALGWEVGDYVQTHVQGGVMSVKKVKLS